jgi:hypothetical protein
MGVVNSVLHDLRNVQTITKAYIQLFDHMADKDLCAEECFRIMLAVDEKLEKIVDELATYRNVMGNGIEG